MRSGRLALVGTTLGVVVAVLLSAGITTVCTGTGQGGTESACAESGAWLHRVVWGLVICACGLMLWREPSARRGFETVMLWFSAVLVLSVTSQWVTPLLGAPLHLSPGDCAEVAQLGHPSSCLPLSVGVWLAVTAGVAIALPAALVFNPRAAWVGLLFGLASVSLGAWLISAAVAILIAGLTGVMWVALRRLRALDRPAESTNAYP